MARSYKVCTLPLHRGKAGREQGVLWVQRVIQVKRVHSCNNVYNNVYIQVQRVHSKMPPPQMSLLQLTFRRCPAQKVKQKSFLFEVKSWINVVTAKSYSEEQIQSTQLCQIVIVFGWIVDTVRQYEKWKRYDKNMIFAAILNLPLIYRKCFKKRFKKDWRNDINNSGMERSSSLRQAELVVGLVPSESSHIAPL